MLIYFLFFALPALSNEQWADLLQ